MDNSAPRSKKGSKADDVLSFFLIACVIGFVVFGVLAWRLETISRPLGEYPFMSIPYHHLCLCSGVGILLCAASTDSETGQYKPWGLLGALVVLALVFMGGSSDEPWTPR